MSVNWFPQIWFDSMEDILLGAKQTSTAPLLSLFGKAGLLYKKKSDFCDVVNEQCVSILLWLELLGKF